MMIRIVCEGNALTASPLLPVTFGQSVSSVATVMGKAAVYLPS